MFLDKKEILQTKKLNVTLDYTHAYTHTHTQHTHTHTHTHTLYINALHVCTNEPEPLQEEHGKLFARGSLFR